MSEPPRVTVDEDDQIVQLWRENEALKAALAAAEAELARHVEVGQSLFVLREEALADAAALRTALGPLAAFAAVIPDAEQYIHRDDAPVWGYGEVELTYGDIRRAAEALDRAAKGA